MTFWSWYTAEINSVDIKAMVNVIYFRLDHTLGGLIDTGDFVTWNPQHFQIEELDNTYVGKFTFNTADITNWTSLATLWLYELHASTGNIDLTFTASDLAVMYGLSTVFMRDMWQDAEVVDEILYGLYQCSASGSRLVEGGAVTIDHNNQDPTGTNQACQSCPVDGDTPGLEVRHEMINDGCGVGFGAKAWTTVAY